MKKTKRFKGDNTIFRRWFFGIILLISIYSTYQIQKLYLRKTLGQLFNRLPTSRPTFAVYNYRNARIKN